uniref:DUF4050 domain-containing protein n=1 Tax=Cannabis sativa TaxID=3483 RepID=A0A803NLP4_CANSA
MSWLLELISGVNQYLLVEPDLKQSRGCFGCFTKPSLIIAVDEPSKGLTIQGKAATKASFSEDIWSSSTIEMDNSGFHSQRSISLGTSNHVSDPHATSSSPREFVNHGKSHSLASDKAAMAWKQKVSDKDTKPRAQDKEMIDFLVDLWEQEGLYD